MDQRWIEWTDAEVLEEIHKLKKLGYGEITIEVHEHKVRTVTPSPDLRKTAPPVALKG